MTRSMPATRARKVLRRPEGLDPPRRRAESTCPARHAGSALHYARRPKAFCGARFGLFTRCLICHSPFEENETLEQLPRGDRIAYDPGRGRLWLICRACRRWSLIPLESRWEALEELEKLVQDRARLLSQTENIALLKAERLEVVRVG